MSSRYEEHRLLAQSMLTVLEFSGHVDQYSRQTLLDCLSNYMYQLRMGRINTMPYIAFENELKDRQNLEVAWASRQPKT